MLLIFTAASPYEWPLREPPALTSSFGEYRSGHFHGGIDLSTGGRTGVPVVAVDDGYVERVRASGAGYGRAIYLRLADGRTAVYAHLSGFVPAIRGYVEAAQDSLARYEVDLSPPARRLSVSRGEVIGYSGQSGAGPAHFHFEMRQGDDGLNPLLHGFPMTDAFAPSILEVDLVPLDGEARAGGSPHRIVVWPAAARSGQRDEPVPVRGRLGLSVRVRDRAPGRQNALAVFEAEAFVDGSRFFASRFDSVSWLRTHEVDAAYDFTRVLEGRGGFLRLWRLPGTTARIYEGEGELDSRALKPGVHTVEVVVSDAAGNRARRSFRIVSGSSPRILSCVADAAGPGRRLVTARVAPDGATEVTASWSANGAGPRRALLSVGEGIFGDVLEDPGGGSIVLEARDGSGSSSYSYPLASAVMDSAAGSAGDLALRIEVVLHVHCLEARVISPEALIAPPTVRFEGPAGSRMLDVEPAGGNTYRATFTPRAGEVDGAVVETFAAAASGRRGRVLAPVSVKGIVAGSAGRVTFDDGALVLEHDRSSFFGDALVAAARIESGTVSQGLAPISAAYRLEPRDAVLDGGILLGIRLAPSEGSHAGLYRRDGGRWSFAGSATDTAAGLMTARVRRLGDYALLRDDTPPILYNVRPAPGGRTDARPRIAASVRDTGSGVTAATLEVHLDGHPVVAEYDPEARSLTVHLRRSLAPGSHEARFEARDRAGNRTSRTVPFKVMGATEGRPKR